jgi:hypothetical protein
LKKKKKKKNHKKGLVKWLKMTDLSSSPSPTKKKKKVSVGLEAWPKQESTCLTSMKSCTTTKKKKKKPIVLPGTVAHTCNSST